MPRAKKTATAETTTKVSADDFLAELEASEDALALDEEDEIVSEDDILAELNDDEDEEDAALPAPATALPAHGPDPEVLHALAKVTAALEQTSEALRTHVSDVEKRLIERQELLAKGLGEVLKQVGALAAQVLTLASKASEPSAPKVAAKADTFVAQKPASGDGVVDRFMLKEVTGVCEKLPRGFKASVTSLAKAIQTKRFPQDPAATPKVEAVLRQILHNYGTVSGDMFSTPPKEVDIDL